MAQTDDGVLTALVLSQKQIYSSPFLRSSCVYYSDLTIDPGLPMLQKHTFLSLSYTDTHKQQTVA